MSHQPALGNFEALRQKILHCGSFVKNTMFLLGHSFILFNGHPKPKAC